MPFYEYHLSGTFLGATGCSNVPSVSLTVILDDLLEPYTFQAVFIDNAPSAVCSSRPPYFGINLLDKNGNYANTETSCLNQKRTSGFGCGRYGGVIGLTITKGASVENSSAPQNSKWSCVDGQCRLVANGAFNSFYECQAVCKPIDGEPCNCPPPSICLSQEEAKSILNSLRRLNGEF